ncbi:hypothetical protein yc1106_09750 [Curvularia clavata]|uniref:Uncharacterized protein n=1 Tax=Curvularia clavata TaxID=95742 RepID=A0A9Q9DYD4_CURCL|nr:hypothetical protein yc1106_09750 [Curvularia clavata]
MLQTLKAQPPPLPASHECPTQTATTDVLVDNSKACLMPKSGPISKTYHLPPRRQQKRYTSTQQNANSTMPFPISTKQGTRGKSDAVSVGSGDEISISSLRKQYQGQNGQKKAPITPTKKASSRQTPLSRAIAVDSDANTDRSFEMPTETEKDTKMEPASPTLLQQRRDHWNGLHIGRDPYGLASKEYLDAGLPPPWPRCDWCEEEIPWLQRKS